MLIRRVWLGHPRRDLVERQRKVYDSYAGGAAFGDDQTISTHDPDEAATRLYEVLVTSGASALNLRVHLPGTPPDQAREQIAGLGSEIVPRLKKLLQSAA
jgi:hypothetical protein